MPPDPFAALGIQPPTATPPPAVQQGGPDAFSALGIDTSQSFAPTPPPEKVGKGIGQNFAAGANRTIFGALGAPVDAAAWLLNKGAQGINAATGAHLRGIQNPVGGSQWINQEWANLTGTNPESIQPVTPGERVASATGSAVASVPLMAMEGAGAARTLPSSMPIARNVAQATQEASGTTLPGALRVTGVVGAGGATGQIAEDEAPEPLKPVANLAGNLVGAAGAEGSLYGLGRGYNAATTSLGERGFAVPRILGGPGKTAVMEPDANGNMVPSLGSNGKPLNVTQSQINKAASKVTGAAGSDVGALNEALNESESQVPGVQRTLAQQAPVPGIVDLDTAYRTAYGRDFSARLHQQGAALTNATLAVAPPDANAQSVGKLFTDQLAALEAERNADTGLMTGIVRQNNPAASGVTTPETQGAAILHAVENQQAPLRAAAEQNVQQAQGARNQALEGAPGGRQPIPDGATVPEQYGAEARSQILTNRQATTDQEAALWRAINPDGNAGAYSAPFKSRMQDVYSGIPRSAVQPGGEEAQIMSTVNQWPDLVPLTEVEALRGRINDAISQEVESAGKTPTAVSRRLVQAKQALDAAMQQTLDEEGHKEAAAVQSGQAVPERTIEANVRNWVQNWNARRQVDLAADAGVGGSNEAASFARGGGGANTGGYASRGAAAASGVSGATSATGRRIGNSAGAPGIPEAERPLTSEELARAKSAREFSQKRAQTFDEGIVGDLNAPGPNRTSAQVPGNVSRTRGGFDVPDAEVVSRIWNGKDTEAANLRAAQAAGVSPETLKNFAADDLRKTAVDPQTGAFDRAAYSKWRRGHAAGLHIFPEVGAAFDNAANAQAALEAAQGAAGAVEAAYPLKGIKFLSEIPGKYLQPGDTGADSVRQFVRDTGGDPHAMQALDDHIVYRMTHEPGLMQPDGTVNADALARFRRRFSGALSQRNELSDKLSNLANAQGAADQVLGDHQARIEAFQNGVAQHFLNDEPAVAVRKAFGPNSNRNLRQLVDAVRHDPDALAGLQRAVADHIADKMLSARPATADADFLKSAQFRAFVKHNKDGLRALFGGQGMQNMEQVAAELRRMSFASEAARGSPTAQRLIGAEKEGLRGEGGHSTMFGAIMGGTLGHVAEFPVVGAALGAVSSKLTHAFKQSGINTTNDLVSKMLLHLPVAREMLARSTNGHIGPVFSQRIARALQATAAAQPSQEKPQ